MGIRYTTQAETERINNLNRKVRNLNIVNVISGILVAVSIVLLMAGADTLYVGGVFNNVVAILLLIGFSLLFVGCILMYYVNQYLPFYRGQLDRYR